MPIRRLSAIVIALGPAFILSAQTPSPEAIKSIGARYQETEENLVRLTHLTWRLDDPEAATTRGREAWLDGNGVARKVSTEEADSHGTTSRTYYLDAAGLFFLLKRAERAPNNPKGLTVVDEERLYFDGGRLIRHLAKTATFKPGEVIDTAKAKNTTEALPADDGGFKALGEEAAGVVAALRGSGAVPTGVVKSANPAAAGGGIEIVKPSAAYRLIEGTSSPDGRLALAWAPAKSSRIDWAKFAQEDGSYLAEDPESVVNFLVETAGGRIVANLAGKHFGDKADYNHFSGSALWSPNSQWVLQLLNRKWETESAHLYCLLPNGKVAGPLDLAATAGGLAHAHLKTANHPSVAKFGNTFAITLYDVEWSPDGALNLRVLGQIPKSLEEASGFELALELAFAVDGNGQIEARRKSIRTLD